MKYILLIFFLGFLIGCGDSYCPNVGLSHLESKPLCTNCQSPNIHKISPKKAIITFIQSQEDDSDCLVMMTLKDEKLSEPQTISCGKDWFVNWADIPSIVALDESGTVLMAHWLQMSAEGTYDYEIRCSISKDNGISWGQSFVLHDDKTSAEHGFVTMATDPKGAFVTWLDGRNTKTPNSTSIVKADHNHDEHAHTGTMPMTLRAAWIDTEGKKHNDLEIDNRVCDCCQTDAVVTKNGPIVVYRDRSNDEVRDISIAKFKNDKWTHKILHKDNWTIAGCPVNGPAIAFKNGIVAVTWYTQVNNIPKVFLSISEDYGNTFLEQPILIAEDEVIGRLDIAIDENNDVIVTYLDNDETDTYISSRIYSLKMLILHGQQILLKSKNERSSGFPIIEKMEYGMIMVRTKSDQDNRAVYLEFFAGL